MGKYQNSEIHNKYSDWHWKLVSINDKYKRLYQADIDRLWIEYDFVREEVIAVIDIKWDNNEYGITATEKGIYEWFEKKGAKVYTVYISENFNRFRVMNSKGKEKIFNSIGYADWLLSLRGISYQDSTKKSIKEFFKGYKDEK